MSSNPSNQDDGTWALPKFRFEVDFGTGLNTVSFREVSGLDVEGELLEYRETNSPSFSTIKMPGIAKYAKVTLKTGVFVNDNTFWEWHKQISRNLVKRRTISIKLLDERGQVIMTWQLQNALPIKVISADLNSKGNEVVVDSIEIAHEQIVITNG